MTCIYKIYKIVDNTNNNVYIGQTKSTLTQRMASHRYNFKNYSNCSSKLILKNNDWYYELIEETNDKSREIYWIKNTKNCINFMKYNFDKKEYDKKYYKKNYEKNEQNRKKWLDDNKQNKANYDKIRRDWIKTFGYKLDNYNHNNLLRIDPTLFS